MLIIFIIPGIVLNIDLIHFVFRVQDDGPKFTDITIKTPLVYRYFTDHGTPMSLKDYEDTMYSDKGRFLMAHNGWVMSSDPLKNFAAPDTKVRRRLIIFTPREKF